MSRYRYVVPLTVGEVLASVHIPDCSISVATLSTEEARNWAKRDGGIITFVESRYNSEIPGVQNLLEAPTSDLLVGLKSLNYGDEVLTYSWERESDKRVFRLITVNPLLAEASE